MTLVGKKNEKDFHSRPTLKSEEMVMEQLTYNDMQDAHLGTAVSLPRTVGGKVLGSGPSDVTTPHSWVNFSESVALLSNFSSYNLFHHQDKKQEQQAINIRETS